MLEIHRVLITGLRPPKVKRRCARCAMPTWFASSQKFRVNAQKKKLDAWLIYRCERCHRTWNRTVFERADVGSLEPDYLNRLTANDARLAMTIAIDTDALRRQGIIVEQSVPVIFAGHRDIDLKGRFALQIKANAAINSRTDRVLAQLLGVSRSQLQKFVAEGHVKVAASKLRRPLGRSLEVICEF